MKNSFINSILEDLVSQDIDLLQLQYVVPSRRVGLFLQQALIAQYNKPIISPVIMSIEDYIQKVSGLQILPDLDILPYFYKSYCKITPESQRDSFDTFITWAPTILQDFNELDRYLVQTDDFFNYLGNFKALDSDRHWSLEANPTIMITQYLDFWKKLASYYKSLNELLLLEGIAYQGMAYRTACKTIVDQNGHIDDNKKLVFLGLNALNKAESTIIQYLLDIDHALIYWDADNYFISRKYHEAGKFMRDHLDKWPFYRQNDFKILGENFERPKEIEIVSATGNLGVVQAARKKLEEITAEQLENTVVILADEQLLLPFLNALPDNIPFYNITMGLSLDNLPISSFFIDLFELHRQYNDNGFYYRNLIKVLETPFTNLLATNEVKSAIERIRKKNIIQLQPDEFDQQRFPFIHKLLKPLDRPADILKLTTALMEQLKEALKAKHHAQLELEQLLAMTEVSNELSDLLRDNPSIDSMRTLSHLLRQLLPLKKLDFIGEPVQGLQIMGLLETRALDYDHIIMLSVNEGTLPAGKSFNSYIPHEMKKAFELPTYTEKDSIYAYHFYRLLHRCSSASFIYNNETETLGGGEQSRFLLQLQMEPATNHIINEISYYHKVEAIEKTLTQINKEPIYFERLDQIASSGFSPSALTSYIRNPLDFFSNKILRINDLEDVEENIALNTMGSIIHEALDQLYQPYQNLILVENDFLKIHSQIKTEIDLAYSKYYPSQSKPMGKNRIIYEVALHYVRKMINVDQQLVKDGNELIIKSVEQNLETIINIDHIGPVKLHGKVDRVDSLNKVTRIIDYKSGTVSKSNVGLAEDGFKELTENYDKSKAFQVLMYAYLYSKSFPENEVTGGIISFKNFKEGFIPFSIKQGRSYKEQPIDKEILKRFEECLIYLVTEIYDPQTPLTEKET